MGLKTKIKRIIEFLPLTKTQSNILLAALDCQIVLSLRVKIEKFIR